MNERMHHQEKDRSLGCEDIYPPSLSVTSGPFDWVCVRLSKNSTDRNLLGFITGQTALDQRLAKPLVFLLRKEAEKENKNILISGMAELFCEY